MAKFRYWSDFVKEKLRFQSSTCALGSNAGSNGQKSSSALRSGRLEWSSSLFSRDRSVRAAHDDYNLWDYMSGLPVVGTYQLEVEPPRVAKQKVVESRTATLEIRYARVELKRNPKKMNYAEYPPFIPAWVVWAKEMAPGG